MDLISCVADCLHSFSKCPRVPSGKITACRADNQISVFYSWLTQPACLARWIARCYPTFPCRQARSSAGPIIQPGWPWLCSSLHNAEMNNGFSAARARSIAASNILKDCLVAVPSAASASWDRSEQSSSGQNCHHQHPMIWSVGSVPLMSQMP